MDNFQKKNSSIYPNPLVSIIINCFNGEEFLIECVNSVIGQSYTNWEIIFIDNNSTDSSGKIINSFTGNIKYYKLEKTIPLYEARNFALDHVNGQVVAFLDCDDFWHPDKLELQLEFYKQGYALIYSSYSIINSLGMSINCDVLVGENEAISSNSLLRRNMISISSVIVDSSLVKKYRFNPRFNLIGDFDLWIRLSLNYKFYSINKVLQFNREHQNNLSKKLSNNWILERREFICSNFWDLLSSFNLYIFIYYFKAELNSKLYVYKKYFKK
jgi:glycosyltransferase involved in cell wall biosynthesis